MKRQSAHRKENPPEPVPPVRKGAFVDIVLNVAIGVLTLTAVILGVLIYQEMGGTIPLPKLSSGPRQAASTPAANATKEAGTASGAALTGERAELLVVPAESADEKTKAAYMEKLNQAAREVNAVTLTKCQSDPIVVKTSKGKKLTVKNADAAAVTVKWTNEKSSTIQPNQSQDVVLDFVPEQGIITYSCGNDLAGMLLLAK